MPRGKSAKSLALIDGAAEILRAIQPASVRAVCYQLFVRQVIPAMSKPHTNRVSTQLVYAREQGAISWDWIVEETRATAHPGTWENPESFIPVVMAAYRRDRWALQSQRVEVWSEKGTVRGTLAPVPHEYGIPFRVMHGYGGATAVYQAAQESTNEARPLTVLYAGDWDPSGLHMSAVDLPRRLLRYGGSLTLRRLAITQSDVHAGLPHFHVEAKRQDPRYGWFRASVDDPRCVELDAMDPNTLRDRVEEAITHYIAWPAWERCALAEQAEQASLQAILGAWPKQSISGQELPGTHHMDALNVVCLTGRLARDVPAYPARESDRTATRDFFPLLTMLVTWGRSRERTTP